MGAAGVDDALETIAAELAEGGVDGEAAGPARPFEIPVDLVAGPAFGGDVAGGDGEAVAMGGAVADDGEAAVVGDVEPLVTVGGPTVGELDAGHERALGATGAGHEAEGAVDVDPYAGGVGDGDEFVEGVEGGDVQVGGVEDDDGGACFGAEGLFELCDVHAAEVVGGESDEIAIAETQDADGAVDGVMTLGGGDDADARRAAEAGVVHVPAGALKDGVPRGDEAGDVGELAAGGEGEGCFGGKVEHLFEPVAGDFFGDGGGGAARVEGGVLVPGRCEPVGGEGGLQCAANDPCEKSTAGAAVVAAVGGGDEVVDDAVGGRAALGDSAAESGAKLLEREPRADGCVVQAVEIARGVVECPSEGGVRGGVVGLPGITLVEGGHAVSIVNWHIDEWRGGSGTPDGILACGGREVPPNLGRGIRMAEGHIARYAAD